MSKLTLVDGSDRKKEKPSRAPEGTCKYCERAEELRFGGCWECAELESIFFDREDMWDNDYSDWTKGEVLALVIRKAMQMSATNQPNQEDITKGEI